MLWIIFKKFEKSSILIQSHAQQRNYKGHILQVGIYKQKCNLTLFLASMIQLVDFELSKIDGTSFTRIQICTLALIPLHNHAVSSILTDGEN